MPRPRAKAQRFARPPLVALIAALGLLLLCRSASAHSVGISRGDYRLNGVELTAAVTFARAELALAVPELEAEPPAASERALSAWSLAGLRVLGDGRACLGTLVKSAVGENDGLTLWLRYVCPAAPAELELDVEFVKTLPTGHRHLAHFSFGQTSLDRVAERGNAALRMTVPLASPAPGAAPFASPGVATAASALARFRSFFVMGVEHILTGYDHLLFLVGLLLVLGPVRSLVGAITAFTLAHSLTLSLATLDLAAPSPRLIEPLIAASIAYVGIENWFVRDAVGRWRVTFCFGLIHGFGFAGALREIALPRAEVPLALFSFNLGVEAGQLAVVAVLLPALLMFHRRGWLEPRAAKVLSLPVAALGFSWFVSRLVTSS